MAQADTDDTPRRSAEEQATTAPEETAEPSPTLSGEQDAIRSAFIARFSKSSPLDAGDATRMEVPVGDRALRGAYVAHYSHETGEAAGDWQLPGSEDSIRRAYAAHMAAHDSFPIGNAGRARRAATSGKKRAASTAKKAKRKPAKTGRVTAQRSKAQKRTPRAKRSRR